VAILGDSFDHSPEFTGELRNLIVFLNDYGHYRPFLDAADLGCL
jgi:hypothetical protein